MPANGDYVWITSLGEFSFGTWTDYRNTVPGTDRREHIRVARYELTRAMLDAGERMEAAAEISNPTAF